MTFFSQQCKLVINDSVLPTLTFLIDKRINYVTIENDEIISLIRKINPNKATGPDGISGQMLLFCDESVILPLQIILTTSIYRDVWKLANAAPILKRAINDKLKIIGQYHFSLFVETSLKKLS